MYSQITSNKRKTNLLLFIFSIFAIAFLSIIMGVATGELLPEYIILSSIFVFFYSLISFYFSDKVALSVSGAKQIQKSDHRELYLLVENLCITAGLPMPKIYIINDPAPNAFATGRDPKNASVAFTTGILQLLDKKELEGVIAHELAHIKNYDIRIMTIVVVLVGLIVLISDILIHLRFDSKNSKSNLVFFIIAIIAAILTPIIAKIIQLAISRTREYLADASGALLTRYPEGLASALQKISQYNAPMKKANHATAHLFISNPFGKGKGSKLLGNLFSTHPPVEQRIEKLKGMGGGM